MGVTYKALSWDPDYKIGSDGSVWSKKRGNTWRKRKLTKVGRNNPYLTVCICIAPFQRKGFKVAHLVLEAFVGPRPKGMEACHFPDRDVSNNRLDNLRWDTRSNNFKDRDIHNRTALGRKHGMAKLDEIEVLEIRRLRRNKVRPSLIAKMFKVHVTLIWLIVKRKIWRHI